MRLSTNIWVREAAESPGYRMLLTTAVAVSQSPQVAETSPLLRWALLRRSRCIATFMTR